MALGQRVSRLEDRLSRPLTPCPACGGRFVMIVRSVPLDGCETVEGARCPRCGSPDAVEFVLEEVPAAGVLDGR